MQSIFKQLWKFVTHVQVLIVFLAFALMVLLSYNFMSSIERSHLLKDVDNAFKNTQAYIETDLKEPETALSVVSENIRSLILNGASWDDILNYLKDINAYLISRGQYLSHMVDIFAYIDGRIVSSLGWNPPDDYIGEDRPWYIAAVEADGSVGITEPYLVMAYNEVSLTFARQIFDNENKSIGIVCLNIMLGRIGEYAVNAFISRGSYGILLDSNFNVIAHPLDAFLGRNIDLMNDGVAIREILQKDGIVSERKATDYLGEECVLFVRGLNNGWHLAILAYTKYYYQGLKNIGRTLTIISFILAVSLSVILLSIVASKRKNEERTMMMLDTTPLGITLWDKECNLIDFNMEAARVVGIYNKQEYREKFAQTAPEFQPDGTKTIEKLGMLLNKAFTEGQCQSIWYHNHINGEAIPFDAKSFRIEHKSNPFIITYCRDLREHYSAMDKVNEAEERAKIMLDTTPLVIDFWDKNFNIIDCSQEAVKLFGLSDKSEYLSKYEELSPEYQPDGSFSAVKNNEALKKAFSEGSYRFEWLHRNINGELIPCEVTLIRVKFRNEDMVCGYTRDLRELKTLMAKMREADECTQILFDTSPLSCIMMDRSFNVIECNQEITRLFEIPDKQVFFDKVFSFSPEYQPSGEQSREKMLKNINEAFEEGYCRFEWMHQKIDGEQIPTEVFFVRVKFRGMYAVAGYIRDLREIKAMIAEMRRAEIAEESSKAKSDFLAKMSHEIRTPMNAILGIAEIQLQDNSLPMVTKEALERIYNSGDLLLGIINDILDLSKIEAGKLELVKAQYDVASLIHDIAKLNIIRYESKPIEFKVSISENVPKVLIGDELRIKQVLNNILSNAFKYTQEGTVELSLNIEPSADESITTIVFCVSDTGQGMTKEQVKQLGEKYSRFNMEANRKTEGTGLGMNITNNLINLMSGKIFVESTPGMGSVFTVKLPQEFADKDVVGKELAENLKKLNLKTPSKLRNVQITQEFMPYGRVLIVDDVETNLYVARGLMAPYGLSVDTAMSGFEAIDKIKGGAVYDMIFMDHMMPKMDGIEAVKIIREYGYKGSIAALTANALAGQAEVFFKNGFDDFISKPIDIRQLNNILNKYVRDKQPQDILDEARRQKNSLYAAGGQGIAIDLQLAEFFVRDAVKAVNVLETICENNCRRADDIPIFIINIHAMKSALANVGERDLSNDAMQLEQAGRDHNIALILSRLPEFLGKLRGVIDKLKPNDDADGSEDGNMEDFPDKLFLQEKLLVIQASCASMDKKAAKEAVMA
ncbi:MAG: response regulator [Treponema sp.]|jgi:signal transduction histidine kinase/CheY-like chemotaxis protein/HPt (histidine-containing phosphotransfer) domain-containing protein|nr:response regulator [Treponema sp.]